MNGKDFCKFEEDFKRGNLPEEKAIKYAIVMKVFKDKIATLSNITENENLERKETDFVIETIEGNKSKIEFKRQECTTADFVTKPIIEIMHNILPKQELIGWVDNIYGADYIIIIKKYLDNFSYFVYDYKKLSDSFDKTKIIKNEYGKIWGEVNWLGKNYKIIKNKPTKLDNKIRNQSTFIIVDVDDLNNFLIDSETNIQTTNLLNWIGGRK